MFSSLELCEIEAKKFEDEGCCCVIDKFALDKIGCLAQKCSFIVRNM